MQKWEYRILSFHLGRTEGGYSVDGKVFEHRYGTSTAEGYPVLSFKSEMLGKMGAEGWELITTENDNYVFKRLISN